MRESKMYNKSGTEEEIRFLSLYVSTPFYTTIYRNNTGIKMSAVEHYCKIGWKMSYDPHPLFSTARYLSINKDVKKININPFYHAMKHGVHENRICPMSEQRYLFWILTA